MFKRISPLHIGIICIGITTIGFSTLEIIGKMIADSIHPFQLTFIRFFLGGLFLLPFALMEMHRRSIRLKVYDFMFFAVTGVIGIVVSMCMLQSALLYTKAALVAVIFSSNPLFTAPLAHIVLHERMNRRKFIALGLSVVGVVLIFNPFSITPDIKGMGLALATALSFSFYTVISKSRIQRYGGLILNSFSFLSGTAILLVLLFVLGIPVVVGISSANIAHLSYLGIFVTGIGYYCYFTAMKHTSAITASTVFFIKPALASVLSAIILRESFTPTAVVGIVLIIASSYLMLRPART